MIGFPSGIETSYVRRRDAPLFATRGMVASAHPLVTSAGLDVLQRGGNAVDAAVAAGLAASVVLPEMCGLGGDIFSLVYDPATQAVTSLQGSGVAPRSATYEQMRAAGNGKGMPGNGPLSITVPGMVHGYGELLDRFGTRGFGELAEHAIEYADGHPITPERTGYIAKFVDLLSRYPSSAAVFLPEGGPPQPGTMLRQSDLARTLRLLAKEGPNAFYQGDLAARMAHAVTELGGALSADDFAGHATQVSAPLTTSYRDYTIFETNLPSQGLIVLEALNIAEQFDVRPGTADATHVLVEAIKLAFADKHAYCQDPATGESPVDALLSKEWAADRARLIDKQAMQVAPAGDFSTDHTTYLCVVDGNGMMVSLIQSVAANFGSGIVAGDTGVVLNNRASALSLDPASPNVFAPGKKPMHTLNCYLVADPTGRLALVGGTPGGDRQPQWNVQVLSGLIDAQWDAQQSIEQPLWITAPTSAKASDYTLTIERRADPAVLTELTERGHRLELRGEWLIDSVAQVIARDPDTAVLAGGTDSRSEGTVAGF